MAAVLDSTEDLDEAIARLIDALAAGLEQSDFADGCPIATVALETASDSEAMRSAAQAAFDSWLEVLRDAADRRRPRARPRRASVRCSCSLRSRAG